jgi:hypothetical protein
MIESLSLDFEQQKAGNEEKIFNDTRMGDVISYRNHSICIWLAYFTATIGFTDRYF